MNLRELPDTVWVRQPHHDDPSESYLATANEELRRSALAQISSWWASAVDVVDPTFGDRTVPRSLDVDRQLVGDWFGSVDRVVSRAPVPNLGMLAAPVGHIGDPPALRTELFASALDPSDGASRCNPAAANAFLDSGAVLRVAKADLVDEDCGMLARAFERASGTLTNVHFYVSSGIRSGSGLHHDTMDVLAFQLEGSKHWRLFAAGVEPAADDLPCIETTLRPGTGLLVPRGAWHEPTPTEGVSVHASVAMLRPDENEARRLFQHVGTQPPVHLDSPRHVLEETSAHLGARLRPRSSPPLLALRSMLQANVLHPPERRWQSIVRTGVGIAVEAPGATIPIAVGGWVLDTEPELVPLVARLTSPEPVDEAALIDLSPAPPDATRQFVAAAALAGITSPQSVEP